MPFKSSAVSIFPMADPKDVEYLAFRREADPVTPEPKTKFAVAVLKLFHVAIAGDEITMQAFEQAHRSRAVETAHIRTGRFGPGRMFCHLA
jgi:hypothetical protein